MLHGRDDIESDKTWDSFDHATENFINHFERNDQWKVRTLVYAQHVIAYAQRSKGFASRKGSTMLCAHGDSQMASALSFHFDRSIDFVI